MSDIAVRSRRFIAQGEAGMPPSWPRVPLPEVPCADLLWGLPDARELPMGNAVGHWRTLNHVLGSIGEGGSPAAARYSSWAEFVGQEASAALDTPAFYHWCRRFHDALAAIVTSGAHGEQRAAAGVDLATQLMRFAPFAVATAAERGAWPFPGPVRLSLPLVLPGMPWRLSGAATVDVLGIADDGLAIAANGAAATLPLQAGASAGRIDVESVQTASGLGTDFILGADGLALPGELRYAAAVGPSSWYRAQTPRVEAALDAVARYAPRVAERFAISIRQLGLKMPEAGGFDDFSEPELPGTFVASIVPNTLELADHFIHEFQHNHLSFLEESGALLDPAAPENSAPRYYSPWRGRPRGLYGIFHGVFVFIAVSRFWLAVARSEETRGATLAYARDRVARFPRQFQLALAVLRGHATPTALGQRLLAELGRSADAVGRELREEGLDRDTPAFTLDAAGQPVPVTEGGQARTVLEGLRAHHAGHAAKATCPEAETILALDGPT